MHGLENSRVYLPKEISELTEKLMSVYGALGQCEWPVTLSPCSIRNSTWINFLLQKKVQLLDSHWSFNWALIQYHCYSHLCRVVINVKLIRHNAFHCRPQHTMLYCRNIQTSRSRDEDVWPASPFLIFKFVHSWEQIVIWDPEGNAGMPLYCKHSSLRLECQEQHISGRSLGLSGSRIESFSSTSPRFFARASVSGFAS